MCKLESLDVTHNALTHLPASVCRLGALERLNISHNRIATLPKGEGIQLFVAWIFYLGFFKRLVISDIFTNISYFTEKIEIAEISNVGNICSGFYCPKIFVIFCNVAYLFTEIKQLKKMKVLEVMNNGLVTLPQEISDCESLNRLLVDRNKLQWLPNRLCELRTLEELSAVGNKLLCLPPGKYGFDRKQGSPFCPIPD